jgi:hypothetical protein
MRLAQYDGIAELCRIHTFTGQGAEPYAGIMYTDKRYAAYALTRLHHATGKQG